MTLTQLMLTTEVLFGKDRPLIRVFAKNLVALCFKKLEVLALDMKDKERRGGRGSEGVIQTCQVW